MAQKPITEEDIQSKLKVTSERLFRSGLSKADTGDLTSAAEDLELAVRYDKFNTNARNLLGLVRFQTGELGEAMKQWNISAHLKKEDNQAILYLQDIEEQETLLTNMSDAIVLYNEALELAGKDEKDFAIIRLKKALHESPQYVKAALLLSVIYIETKSYRAALSVLDEVAKVDPLNPEAMRYRLHIAAQQKEGAADLSDEIRDLSRDLYVQQSLPEPDMEKISSEETGRSIELSARGLGTQLGLLLAGLVLGIGVMAFLYVPGKLKAQREDAREKAVQTAVLQEDRDRLDAQVDQAEDVLKRIALEGEEVTEVMKADIRQLLESWGIDIK